MPGTRLKAILLVVIAIILASGSIGAAYACYEIPCFPPHHPGQTGQMDLKICDQDETWSDGVGETWMAHNMAPGDEYAFDGSFVGLSSQFPRKVIKGMMEITCEYNAWTVSRPDSMAKYMVITRCVYNYANKNETWQINCLTGQATNLSKKSRPAADKDWKIQDIDRDGRTTFYDLRKRPLKDLPVYPGDAAHFELSIRFHEGAGNEFQGDTFTLTMIYTIGA